VYFIRYEDLIDNPIERTAELFRFIGSRRRDGTDRYRQGEEVDWQFGKDDGSDTIRTLQVQKRRNKRHQELIQLIRNHDDANALLDEFGYEPLDAWLAANTKD